MASRVNLDALIPREDFDISEGSSLGTQIMTISINNLKRTDFFLTNLSKPDFQRETSEWDTKKVIEFVESFLNGDLIPAVILWQSVGRHIFVIDGSHRLSALAAWINDDYGDGELSKSFYDGIIPEEQTEIAVRTRTRINKSIGSFKDHEFAINNPTKVQPEIVARAKSMGVLALPVQWLHGNSAKAESSFFKINQQGSPINPTELRVLKVRKTPIGIAARAIVRSGKGYKYWSAFPEGKRKELEQLAEEVNSILFKPQLDTPVKTLDLPIGGEVYAAQSLPLIVEFVNIVNKVSANDNGEPDVTGDKTIAFVKRCKRIAEYINSNAPGSLGLHPMVYFYASNGRHKFASFLAFTALILEFEKRDYFVKFTTVRSSFEELIQKYDYLIQQIVRQRRSAANSYEVIKNFYMGCINRLLAGSSVEQTIEEVRKEKDFSQLLTDDPGKAGASFSKETKSHIFITNALASALRCAICGGYLHRNAISIDHNVRKEDGGTDSVENAQLTHPYCNTGYKESMKTKAASQT